MGIKLKTKQERKDTPLGATPDSETPVTDVKTALADINKRADARRAAINESRAKVEQSRKDRSRAKNPLVAGGNLYGLASFKNTTGKQQE